MSKHTPGPWSAFYKAKYDEWHVSVPISGSSMKLALFEHGIRSENPKADARLIAAVPDLLAYAKCEEARSRGEDIAETVLRQFGFDPARSTASEFMDQMRRAAIAKAGGAA